MPTNLRRLLEQAADAELLNTANADVQQMIADGIVIRRSKICPVKRKPVKAAYNTKTEEFYYNADGSAMTLREWRALHGVQPKKQKQRSDTGLRQVIQPGDAIHCRCAELELWLNKKPARYAAARFSRRSRRRCRIETARARRSGIDNRAECFSQSLPRVPDL